MNWNIEDIEKYPIAFVCDLVKDLRKPTRVRYVKMDHGMYSISIVDYNKKHFTRYTFYLNKDVIDIKREDYNEFYSEVINKIVKTYSYYCGIDDEIGDTHADMISYLGYRKIDSLKEDHELMCDLHSVADIFETFIDDNYLQQRVKAMCK